jgi:Ca-activated chloride channel family protein
MGNRSAGSATTASRSNAAYASGHDPLSGAALGANEPTACVEGYSDSAGLVMQRIVDAVNSPNGKIDNLPTVWIPSVSHWLVLTNYQANHQVFDLTDSPATALAPVVMAIWESRLKALQKANPGKDIGWQQLLDIFNNPQGWAAYGFTGRRAIYYGHTDPFLSSTGLSTLIAEYYASARYTAGRTGRRLTLEDVNDKDVQQGVRNIENLIKHYAPRTTEFKEYIARGPDYLDMVALEENDLIYINEGKTTYQPPERLVALYPSEGTFYHEHPFAIPNASWVTADQRWAAEKFRAFVLSVPIQELVLAGGFRPANPSVPLGYPIVSQLGADPSQPRTVLDVPDPKVLSAIQQSWTYVKKRADVWLMIDVSGSMNDENKIGKAREAAQVFLDNIALQNRVGLITFNSKVNVLVKMDNVEANKSQLKDQINGLVADGGTALYDAMRVALQQLQDDENTDHIRAIVLLSDGCDTSSTPADPADILTKISASQSNDANPILVLPVAYGSDACGPTMKSIADASKTKVNVSVPNDIKSIMDILGHLW